MLKSLVKKKRPPKKDLFIQPYYLFTSFEKNAYELIFRLPIKLISEANNHDHWSVKIKRFNAQKRIISLLLKPKNLLFQLPCHIILTRIATKSLDAHDNLPFAFKKIVDYLAELITGKTKGTGDSGCGITWSFEQEKSKEYGIQIKYIYK